jgi:histidyl-tRNA synthetase
MVLKSTRRSETITLYLIVLAFVAISGGVFLLNPDNNASAPEIAVKTEVKAVGDMKIVRGLDYYTGTVFEFNLPEYPGLGSVSGGGRYDNLAGYFTEQKLPGVGGSIGLTRLFYVLTEHNLLKSQVTNKPVDYVVVPISENEVVFSMKVANDLREEGKSATVIFSNKRLGDKLNYASKISKKAIIIGENEAKTGKYEIKELFA